MYADLMQYYQFDLLEWYREGRLAPAPVLALIQGLPEGSRFVAARRGGDHAEEWLGVTMEYRLLANIFDAVNLNTRATGRYKKPPKFEPWPLPEQVQKKRDRGTGIGALLAGGVEGVRVRAEGEVSENG